MPMIVSENKDDSQEPWLLRDDKRPHQDGTPFTTVVARSVRFKQLTNAASGTQAMAICDSAQGSGKKLSIPSHCFRIQMHDGRFSDPDKVPIEKCDTLYFMHDGKMFGAISSDIAEAEKAAA